MRSGSLFLLVGLTGLVSLMLIRSACSDEPSAAAESVTGKTAVLNTPPEASIPRVSLEVARDRAKLLHDVYASTLDVMHRRYFHGDRATVPARAMEDIFSDVRREYSIEARWIAASLRAMNIDHDPETPFEKQAAREITSGKTEVEEIHSGYYRRAVAISLSGGCMNCHSGSLSQSTRKHFAALVISIPIDVGSESAESK